MGRDSSSLGNLRMSLMVRIMQRSCMYAWFCADLDRDSRVELKLYLHRCIVHANFHICSRRKRAGANCCTATSTNLERPTLAAIALAATAHK